MCDLITLTLHHQMQLVSGGKGKRHFVPGHAVESDPVVIGRQEQGYVAAQHTVRHHITTRKHPVWIANGRIKRTAKLVSTVSSEVGAAGRVSNGFQAGGVFVIGVTQTTWRNSTLPALYSRSTFRFSSSTGV